MDQNRSVLCNMFASFGNIQSKMFLDYFSMVGVCCALWFLLSAFALDLANLFIFTPMTIEMMKQRHNVERGENRG